MALMKSYALRLTLLLAVFLTTTLSAQTTKVTIRQEGFGNKHELRVMINNKFVEFNEKGALVYETKMNIDKPVYGMVLNKKSMYTGFWIEAGKGDVIIKKKGFPRSTEVKGSKSHQVYQSLKFPKDNKAFIQSFIENKTNPIALEVLNSTFKFKKFEQDELQRMYNATLPDDQFALASVKAYLNTLGLEKVIQGGEVVDFSGKEQNGTLYHTKDYRGKYVLIDFAATGCGPCWEDYPNMIEESKKYENLQVVTYNEDSAIETWNKIAKSRNIEIPWPVLWKGENKLEVFERYNVEGWPLHFLISPEGKVLDTWFGSGGTKLASTLKEHVK